ncbi:hypothetical protein E2562_001993 [Oryza meyeriana var. granulata]|uniref:Uncharacterized protein n=1 Tax=Oryza meyeriana var. granulata TaxID=110450 RepID=A0A6G1C229_9ORYZ|nr:hypothetical protein E2562_001993 [Oryza meyeriana var. granulata]
MGSRRPLELPRATGPEISAPRHSATATSPTRTAGAGAQGRRGYMELDKTGDGGALGGRRRAGGGQLRSGGSREGAGSTVREVEEAGDAGARLGAARSPR